MGKTYCSEVAYETMTPSEIERFWSYVARDGAGGCWNWTGSLTSGYGTFSRKRGTARAHRIAWELINRKPLPPLSLDHLCRNRRCCNPLHLEPVTERINTARGLSPTAMNMRKLRCPKGHLYEGDNLRIRPDGARECKTCHIASYKAYIQKKRLKLGARFRWRFPMSKLKKEGSDGE